MRLRFFPKASTELRDAIEYLQERNPEAARRLVARFERRWQLLLLRPLLGAAREDIGPGIRHSVVEPYVILYRVTGEDLEIVRVLHGKRKIDRDAVDT